ncbi:MAG: energy-coupling factor ABC transporter ATP-binding protein [Anaerolineae bacterium]
MNDAIQITQLSFSYPDGRQALSDINLTVAVGEKVAIVGPNGAGKSTLLLHLNGTLRGQGRGQVRIAGLEVVDKTVRWVRAKVGLVFQDPDDQLFSTSVLDDVAFGPLHLGLPLDQVYRRASQALAAVGMSGYEEQMPHHLSLGERKRIAIATVLAMEPEILVLDEPSSGLDPRARRNLISLLRRLPQTMVLASHDMRLVWDLCPRTIILDGGRLVADGPTVQLLQDQALMERHGLEVPFALAPLVSV